MLFYFALGEQKIIVLGETRNRHIISELMVGLVHALSPLTYIYPIVAATISPHHMEFANSPVPLFVGLWGNRDNYHSAQ